ncbi:histone-lysine N-methyltransferase, H3 lysine-36 specific [Polytolypa hystricis UAMH7299]|uniref:Histone-lysine N-methyltransferase, H3 lysine-36 specific n=1 Tax=Polytolypa hystricis (strain UAMH7299) TaxID=1447883 RepID=A0A2B7XCK5_POLH7|nr:histone-lysine N-methyltransferase, H3 lysine-36 specific [Polytolypa hystricis UAMH7299]
MARHVDEDVKPESVADAVTDMKLDPGDSPTDGASPNGVPLTETAEDDVNGLPLSSKASPTKDEAKSQSRSQSRSPASKNEDAEEKVAGSITVKLEPGQPPKLTRTSSQKFPPRPVQMFDHLPDKSTEATATFQVMEACTYANKYMGYTEHGMECDCAEEWDAAAGVNIACGEDSDCINRATKMECVGDCGCGADCQNQRFQRREYANVSVIKTEKKGYGLRADSDLRPHQFIFEYIGEVINEGHFRRRMLNYDDEGIKHFYFMSLSKGEFVDATKKGNLGRFCNHSCNPNCYVDKWVVGEKLRMGIFAERHIKAGEELVFNYNVDRYGADPQPCYCGEPNCTGFIGGKTQTERATKLSNATIEALGIDDPEGWDTAVARRPRKKKVGEDDEEYVDSMQPKSLHEDGVTKVMAALMQCKEKWIAVKLLGRIQRCDDERVRNRVVKMHGYQILNSQLNTWKEDFNVVLQIVDILDKFPRLTRNKIMDSKIESTIQPLTSCGDERVEKKASALLEVWSTLAVGYRIPRMKRDPAAANSAPTVNRFERRESGREDRKGRTKSKSRSRSRSRSLDAPRAPAALRNGGGGKGPRPFHHGPRPFRRHFNPLPAGWFAAESNGRTYYYSARGDTTWTRPTMPAPQPPPPPKTESKDKTLQDIIDGIMNAKENTPKTVKEKSETPATPQDDKPEKKEHKEKWRSYSEEKQKRLYENTIFPHIKYVMDKFKHKLPRDDLKRYAKEVGKKLVNSDFKNNRVQDPTKIGEKQVKQIKKYCKEYLDKAVAKHRAYEKKKAEKKAREQKDGNASTNGHAGKPGSEDSPQLPGGPDAKKDPDSDVEEDIKMSDDEMDKGEDKKSSPMSVEDRSLNAESLKRKRDAGEGEHIGNGSASPVKRARSTSPPPPPPPPPPMSPGDAMTSDDVGENLKGKRIYEGEDYDGYEDGNATPGKTQRSETPPPPPPPPPPADGPDDREGEQDERNGDFEEAPDKAESVLAVGNATSSMEVDRPDNTSPTSTKGRINGVSDHLSTKQPDAQG